MLPSQPLLPQTEPPPVTVLTTAEQAAKGMASLATSCKLCLRHVF
jgi:hypothetical protein